MKSGEQIFNNGLLPKSKNTHFIGYENVGLMTNVPTYISVCPFCDFDNKWRTTELLPGYLKCEKCHEKFIQ